jgi:hypothetical protein
MSGLVDTIMAQLSDTQVAAIANRLGTDPAQARTAIEHALPLIVGHLAQNAGTPQGAGSLQDALGAHAGFNVSDVLGSVLGGAGQGTGGGLLGQIFGAKQSAASQGLGQTTGLGQQNAGQLLAILAPVVMAALANHAQGQGLDASGLGGMLEREAQQIQQQGGLAGGLLGAVLNHGGGNLDLSHLLQGAGSVLGAFAHR